MKVLHKILIALSMALALVLPAESAQAAVTFPINGGTGSTTLSGIIIGNGTSPVNSLAIGSGLSLTGTTLANAIGYLFPSNATSTLLTFNGGATFANPFTLSFLGAGTVNATSAGSLYSTATSTPSAGTGIAYSGTFGSFIGGTSGSISNTGVLSFNTRTGAVTLTSGDVTTALGFTPANFGYPFPANATTSLITFSGGITTGGTVTFGSLNGVLHAAAGIVSTSAVNLTSEVTGTLPVSNGGTGSTTLTGLLKGNGTGSILTAIAGTDYQAAGNYITALTGDVTASGPGSVAATLATVNGNVGSFTNANITVNAKGLITAASNGTGGSGTGLSTSSPVSPGNILEYSSTGAGSAFGVATTTLAGTGVISVSNSPVVIGSSGAVASLTGGSNGNILTWLSGVPTWLASTSLAIALSDTTGTLQVARGGTGSVSFTGGQLIGGNGTNALFGVSTTTASCAGTVSCTVHTIIGTSPITITGAASTGNVSTSTNETAGSLAYWTSNSATPALLGKVSTTTLGFSGPFIGASTLGTLVGGSNSTITWTGLATSTQPSSSNLLTSNGGAGVYGTATSTLSATSPLTGSFTQVGSGGALGCQTASGSQAGCLSSADWTTFNGKGSGTVTSITLGGGIDGVSPITTTGTITAQIGTSTVPSLGGLATWTGLGTPSTLGTVATSSATCTSASGITCSTHTVVGSVAPTFALSAIPNSSLANSTISGVALGGTLAALTATNATLTFSGSYTGTAAQTVGINLTNPNTWTGLQQFNANASTTGLTVSGSSFLSTASGGVNIGTTTSFGKALFVEGATSGGVAVIQRDFTSAPTNSFIGTYDVRLNEIGGLADGTGPAQTFGVEASGGAENIQADIGSFRDGADNTGGFAIRPYLAGVAQQVFTIRGSGNVGISSTTPFSTLSINAAAQTNPYFAIGSSSAPVFSISPGASAQLAIATGTPLSTNALTVNGGVYLHGTATGAGNGSVCMTTDGQLLYDAGAACIVSTEHAKHDINTVTDAQANEVLRLNPVQYEYNDGSGTRYGLIAEQVAKIDPTLVIYAATNTPVTGQDGKPYVIQKGQPYTVDYMRYTGLLTAEVQRQQKEIDALSGDTAKVIRSVEEDYQNWALMIMFLWLLVLTFRKRN